VLARLYKIQDAGQLDGTTANTIISTIISYGFTSAMLQCQQSFVSQQAQIVDCNNTAIGTLVQNNPNCLTCKQRALAVYKDRLILEQQAQALNPKYQPQVLQQNLYDLYFGADAPSDGSAVGNAGICQFVCEQCLALNVNQNIQMNITLNCANTVNTKLFLDSFVNGMSLQGQSELTQRVNALKNTGLAIQNQADVKTLSFQMSNTIASMTTVEQLNSLTQTAILIQQTKIDSGSTSVSIMNSTQSISLTMFSSLISKTFTDSSIKASIDYDRQAKLIELETSFSSLIDSLQSTVTTINKLLVTTITEIMLILLVIIMIIALIFAAFLFFNPSLLFAVVAPTT